MDRSRPFHLTARTVILIILHVVAVLLFLRTPKSCSSDKAPLLVTMSAPWIQSQLQRLYEAPDALDDVFDQVFAPACEVRLNHAVQPLQTFKDDLAARRAAATHVSVAWGADIISTNDDPEQPAVVAGAFVVTRSLPFRIRVGPAQRLTHVHFSAKIERDAGVKGDDQRRVTSFYYTSVDRTPPIHFAIPRAAQEGSGGQ